MNEGKRKEAGKVIRRPANICRIDNSITKIEISPEVECKPVEDLGTGKSYQLLRKENGIQMK